MGVSPYSVLTELSSVERGTMVEGFERWTTDLETANSDPTRVESITCWQYPEEGSAVVFPSHVQPIVSSRFILYRLGNKQLVFIPLVKCFLGSNPAVHALKELLKTLFLKLLAPVMSRHCHHVVIGVSCDQNNLLSWF